jgi:glucan phosphoethanolaminetransferase (alkaline phosphatase superfamily)
MILGKKEVIVAIVMIPVMYFMGIWMYVLLNVHAVLWIFLICALLFGTLLTVYSKRIYDRNINALRRNLEELKELEEDEEKEIFN